MFEEIANPIWEAEALNTAGWYHAITAMRIATAEPTRSTVSATSRIAPGGFPML
jgi:hypothetical protein